MAENAYPIYSDDGRMFCKRLEENGNLMLLGPKGKKMSVAKFMEQVYNPNDANKNRNKYKKYK